MTPQVICWFQYGQEVTHTETETHFVNGFRAEGIPGQDLNIKKKHKEIKENDNF